MRLLKISGIVIFIGFFGATFLGASWIAFVHHQERWTEPLELMRAECLMMGGTYISRGGDNGNYWRCIKFTKDGEEGLVAWHKPAGSSKITILPGQWHKIRRPN